MIRLPQYLFCIVRLRIEFCGLFKKCRLHHFNQRPTLPNTHYNLKVLFSKSCGFEHQDHQTFFPQEIEFYYVCLEMIPNVLFLLIIW